MLCTKQIMLPYWNCFGAYIFLHPELKYCHSSQHFSFEKTTSSFTRIRHKAWNVNTNLLSLKKWHHCSLPHLLTRWPAVCWHSTCFGF